MDAEYISKKLLAVMRDLAQYTGDELGRELRRIASTASEDEENAKLREQLAFQTKQGADRLIGICKCGLEREEWKQRAEAAEAKLKAASEQEPCICVTNINDADPDTGEKRHCPECNDTGTVPPADAQECYACKEREQLGQPATGIYQIEQEKCIAELTRKVAEQQARDKQAILWLSAYANLVDMETADDIRDFIISGDEQELNTIIAKAREGGRLSAVPEGWQVVPKEPTTEMVNASWNCEGITTPTHRGQRLRIAVAYHAMLAAAPTPPVYNHKGIV